MNEPTEPNNQPCPGCGYPAQAGHASDCRLVYNSEVDLREAYGGKFINPSSAEGPDVHELRVKDFNLPISFTTEAGRFRINGIDGKTGKGVIASGVFAGDAVKINHIKVDAELRGDTGGALLTDLEEQLKKQGVKVAYSVFANPDTVRFFIKNDYKVTPVTQLTDEQKQILDIDESGFEGGINNNDDFAQALQTKTKGEFNHVLLTKVIS